MAMFAQAAPPSVLPNISPTSGESGKALQPRPNEESLAEHGTVIRVGSRAPSTLPPCGGDARQGRGGYQVPQPAQKFPGKNITWL